MSFYLFSFKRPFLLNNKSAGATAGEKAAIETITKTLEDALNKLHGDDSHKFKIIVKDGTVVSGTGPGLGGESAGVDGTTGKAGIESAETAGGGEGGKGEGGEGGGGI